MMNAALPAYRIGGMTVRLEQAPEFIVDSMAKAFSLSRTTADDNLVSMRADLLEDNVFFETMPDFVRSVYDRIPEHETPVVFAGPSGEFGIIIRSGGSSTYALVPPSHDRFDMRCQRLTARKSPLHFQSVLIPVLKHLLLQQGKLLVHAGCAASEDGRAILFAGLSGSGKSTTCIALTRAGFRYLSDDLVVLSFQDGRPVVEAIRENMNLTKQTILFFPELARFRADLRKLDPQEREKLPVNPLEVFGADRMADRAVVSAIMMIQIGKEGPRLVPISPPGVLKVVLQNHTFETAPISRKSMDILWNILGAVKTYQILTGPDPSSMGEHVYREFHGIPSPAVRPSAAAVSDQRSRNGAAFSAAALLRGVLAHTLDGNGSGLALPADLSSEEEKGIVKLFSYHRLDPHFATWLKDSPELGSFRGFNTDRVLSNAAALALSMEKTAETVHQALATANIPALLVRGPAVSKRYYPAETLRFFRDIDLLIPKKLLQQSADVLRSLGYRPDRDLAYWGKRGEWPFSDGTRIVELHWEAYPSPFDRYEGLRGEDLWADHDLITIGSANIACLSREQLLLSSLLHAAYEHHFDRLVRLVDIRQMAKIDGDRIDWDWIRSMIERTGTSVAVLKELECMDAVLPVPVPPAWRAGLRAKALWKTAADLTLPNDAIIAGKQRFSSLRRRVFRYVLKYSR